MSLGIGCAAASKPASGFAVTTGPGNLRRFRIDTDHGSSAKVARSGLMLATFEVPAGSGFSWDLLW